jgi:hypothetical protein
MDPRIQIRIRIHPKKCHGSATLLVSLPPGILCCRAKKNIRLGQAVSMLELTSEDRTQFRLYSDHALRSFTQ